MSPTRRSTRRCGPAADDAPDVVTSFTTNNVGQYCSSGMWADLDPFLKKTGVDKAKVFPRTLLDYTQLPGRAVRAAAARRRLRAVLQQGRVQEGRDHPAPAHHVRAETGRRQTHPAGQERLATNASASCPTSASTRTARTGCSPSGARRTSTARASPGSPRDPATEEFFATVREISDGRPGRLPAAGAFRTTFGDEMSAQNAFLTRKLAMHMDGEWRGLMLAEAKAKLRLGRRPAAGPRRPGRHLRARLSDGHRRRHRAQQPAPERGVGAGEVPDDRHRGGRPLRQRDPQRAVHASTALKSPDLDADPAFRTFLEIAQNPHSQALPPSNNGGQYVTSLHDFSLSRRSGPDHDLHRAFKDSTSRSTPTTFSRRTEERVMTLLSTPASPPDGTEPCPPHLPTATQAHPRAAAHPRIPLPLAGRLLGLLRLSADRHRLLLVRALQPDRAAGPSWACGTGSTC